HYMVSYVTDYCYQNFNLLYVLLMIPCIPISTLFPYTTLFRSKYSFGYRQNAFIGQDIPCGSVLLNKNTKVQLVTKGKHCYSLVRSEEHTSELQSRGHLVCRLLLEKKKN